MRFLDFFAGAGLVEPGLGAAWRCAWANDNDPKKAEVYRANFDPAIYHQGDVALVEANDLPVDVDLAWASFPCQDLSLAGWRRGMSSQRSGTFWAFWRIMRDLHATDHRPPFVVIENVVGLLHGPDFASLCEALGGLGLNFGALVIDAKRFVPQSRPRVFLVAVDERFDTASFETEAPFTSPWHPPAVRAAFARLAENLQARWRWWSLPEPTTPVLHVSSIIEAEPDGVRWNTDEETSRLVEMMSAVNRAKLERAGAAGQRQVGMLYRRVRNGVQRAEVRFDGLAGCLRTPSGGSSRQTVVIVEGDRVRTRLLSPREAARLMGVGDDFSLPASYNQAYQAMGDAVAVPAVAWLADHLLTPLAHGLRDDKARGTSADHQDLRAFHDAAEEQARAWHDARAARSGP